MKIKIPGIILILFLFLSGCEFKTSFSSGEELKGEGITFVVPHETSSYSQGSGGITYSSATVEAKTDGKKLTVGGRDYGALSMGDKVDFREKGRVLVNGVERKPIAP
ncbi:MAG: hypothetical protein EOP86_06395 [Verrucomicrobiaceae bacterium]|nr:MAG: hypothetical protein EOP86_06395 [Verrucomicrobiaceae bacterium]